MNNRSLKIAGITGGVGSGKSFITGEFKNLGAKIIDADKICHELLEDEAIKAQITEIWPTALDCNSGAISRGNLAELAFANKESISKLNKILHPVIIKQIKEFIAKYKKNERGGVVIIDAALLEESGLSSLCDAIIFVETESDLRKKRCIENRNWLSDEVESREKYQMPLSEKKIRAKFIINNGGTMERTIEQVNEIWDKYLN